MELKDKIAITAVIIAASVFGVGVLTFLFGPGITKTAIAVDYTVEDNMSFTSVENPIDLNPDPANPSPYQRLQSASLHMSVTYSNKGTTPASIGRLWVVMKDADKSHTCNGDPENGASVHVLNPEGQSAFAQHGKILASDIERASYEVTLFRETEKKTYPKHALVCAIISGTDSNISTRQAVLLLGRFYYEEARDFAIGTNPTYLRDDSSHGTVPRHLLP